MTGELSHIRPVPEPAADMYTPPVQADAGLTTPEHLAFVRNPRHKAALWLRYQIGRIEDIVQGPDLKHLKDAEENVYYGRK